AKKPEAIDVRELLAKTYLDLKYYDKAIGEYNFLISKKPDYYFYHLQLGSIYAKQKKYTIAEKEYLEAKKLAPDNPLPILYLADLQISKGKLNEAENMVREGLKLSSDNNYAYVLLGDIYERRGAQRKAVFDKKKNKSTVGEAKAAVSLLRQAINYYNQARDDNQFTSYVRTEIERCEVWIKQLEDDIWFLVGGKK
ncbi:MAG: tetratricopeptide repeat protein, partial [candidate division WOR-3 bacterium]